MNVSVFGLGYVGCVTAACFARDKNRVLGVDVDQTKINTIRQGKSPIIEPGLEALLRRGVENELLDATDDAARAVRDADIILICVGTPSRPNGSLDLHYVSKVCEGIGEALKEKSSYCVVVVRSTMLPGSATEMVVPALEAASGKKAGEDFGFCVNPEFLREGTAIYDFDNPPYTVIGELDEKSGDMLMRLYENLDAPVFRVPLGVSEVVKYASNAFHAVKVAFANEIGSFCAACGIDSHKVMDIFVQDTKLNLSPYYLKPGFAFGGSCLPKDLRALHYASRSKDLKLPLVESVLPSNDMHIQRAVDTLLRLGKRKIGLVGLSFKSSTDDLRESPAVEMAEQLHGKGFDLAIYDPEVSLTKIFGGNLSYVEHALPHLSSLVRDSLEELAGHAEVIVVTKKPSTEDTVSLFQLLGKDHIVYDLVRMDSKAMEGFEGAYYGIGWCEK